MNHTLDNREIRVDPPGTFVRLWIDGVGCWVVCPAPSVTLGGPVDPGSSQPPAGLCFLANLRRRHATIERVGESYRLETTDGEVNGRTVQGETFLSSGELITLGSNVVMRFQQPSVLSASAVLTPAGGYWPRMFRGGQTPGSVDGIVLMDEVCLLGPGSDAHVPCPGWEEQIVLHRRDGALWCRASTQAQMDSRAINESAPLGEGVVVSGDSWRFRTEVMGD